MTRFPIATLFRAANLPIVSAVFLGTAATVSTARDSETGFSWPERAEAAVCLTYDDAIDTQLDVALPQLDAIGLPGTFFIGAHSVTMQSRLDEWKALAKTRHELASHSVYHPCRKSPPNRDWVPDAFDLDGYSLPRISAELDVNNAFLAALDERSDRSFAYPCGEFLVDVGSQSYAPIAENKFVAARVTGGSVISIQSLSFYKTPSFDAADKSLDQLVAYVEDAARHGTIAVIMFHGVDGDYLAVDGEVHRAFLDYLDANRDRLWTETYKDAMTHARKEFERLGWPVNP